MISEYCFVQQDSQFDPPSTGHHEVSSTTPPQANPHKYSPVLFIRILTCEVFGCIQLYFCWNHFSFIIL